MEIPKIGTIITRNPIIPRHTGFVKIISGIWIICFYAILQVQFRVSNLLLRSFQLINFSISGLRIFAIVECPIAFGCLEYGFNRFKDIPFCIVFLSTFHTEV